AMKIISIRKYLFLPLFLITGAVFSQDLGSETVVVVKPYTPSVNDASKIKEVPAINDSVNLLKEPVEYRIFSVPVASTFTPVKGRATNIQRERQAEIYDNYATLGFGNHTSILAEFYSKLEINRTDNFGIFLTHNSAQGGIDGVPVDDKYYDTELNLNYTSRQRDLSWNTEFGVEHQLINWYGVDPEIIADFSQPLEPQQNYYSVYAGGELQLEESFFDMAELDYRFFTDAYSSMEHHINFHPSLEIPIAGEIFKTDIIVDFLSGSFDRNYFTEEGINYGFLNLGLSSGILILRDDLSLNLGAAVYYSRDMERQDGGIHVYPRVEASYRIAGEYFVAYAGLKGELNQNTYYDFVQENPFVSPTLEIRPTDQVYEGYLGAKGKFSNSVGYNFRGSYTAENYKPLFFSQSSLRGNTEEYSYGNSFGVIYDSVKTISAFGELSFDVNQDFLLRINAEYFTYDPTKEEYAWNLPNFKASLLADYQIGENWFAGANLFLVGERKDKTDLTDILFSMVVPSPVTIDSYFDINAKFGHRFNEQLSFFVKGNNLLGNNYEKWQGFPVLGLQVMAGVTFKFDY
ncbi:MAG TPA: TonB-dependent receptor, partial [Salinimicrobium sp.]|nr:TonB-dependent receptor [Salinimicrobium sp.]